VAVERPGTAPVPPLPGWRWISLEVPSLEVSSTDLRARVVDGRPLDYLVTHEVVDCIRARGLYREGS
jgi:nicotinate-nucleotide adenylyltransferase